MTPYNQILQLHNDGKNNAEIVRLIGNVSRKTVITVLQLAEKYSFVYPPSKPMTDTEIHRFLHPKLNNPHLMPNIDEALYMLSLPEMSVAKTWRKYCIECDKSGALPYSKAQYQNIINEAKVKQIVPEYRSLLAFRYINDAVTSNDKHYGLLAAELLGSHYIVATLITDKKARTWIHGIVQIIRKLKYLPQTTCFINHLPNSVSAQTIDCLQYYGMAVTQADKTLKTHLPVFMKGVIRCFRDETSDTSPVFVLNMMCNKYNEHVFISSDSFSIEDAHATETMVLQEARTTDYDLVESVEVSPQYNHVQVEGMYYSIPYEYRHEKMTAYISDHYVEIHRDGAILCVHDKLTGRSGQYRTDPMHLPNEKDIPWNETSGRSLRAWAEKIGPSTFKTIDYWLTRVPFESQAYKTCNTVLHFSSKYSSDALERACECAWECKDISYHFIKESLK